MEWFPFGLFHRTGSHLWLVKQDFAPCSVAAGIDLKGVFTLLAATCRQLGHTLPRLWLGTPFPPVATKERSFPLDVLKLPEGSSSRLPPLISCHCSMSHLCPLLPWILLRSSSSQHLGWRKRSIHPRHASGLYGPCSPRPSLSPPTSASLSLVFISIIAPLISGVQQQVCEEHGCAPPPMFSLVGAQLPLSVYVR